MGSQPWSAAPITDQQHNSPDNKSDIAGQARPGRCLDISLQSQSSVSSERGSERMKTHRVSLSQNSNTLSQLSCDTAASYYSDSPDSEHNVSVSSLPDNV